MLMKDPFRSDSWLKYVVVDVEKSYFASGASQLGKPGAHVLFSFDSPLCSSEAIPNSKPECDVEVCYFYNQWVVGSIPTSGLSSLM